MREEQYLRRPPGTEAARQAAMDQAGFFDKATETAQAYTGKV